MMDTTKAGGSRREITMPATAMLDLLDEARAAGDDRVRERGRLAGRLLADRLAPTPEGAAAARTLPADLFWRRVTDLFASRGWGSLRHAAAGPGLGELRSGDWIESERASGGRCAFTAGIIEGLLEGVSGARLEVLEVECRSDGDASCRFLFGSARALAAARRGMRATAGV